MQQNQTCLQQKVVTNKNERKSDISAAKIVQIYPENTDANVQKNCFVDDTVCPKVLLKREKEIFLLNFLNKT